MGGACSTEEEYTGFLVRKPEGKRPLRRPRHRWKDNIKRDIQEVGWGRGDMDWIDLAQVGTCGSHL